MRRGIPRNTSGIRAVPCEGWSVNFYPMRSMALAPGTNAEGNARIRTVPYFGGDRSGIAKIGMARIRERTIRLDGSSTA